MYHKTRISIALALGLLRVASTVAQPLGTVHMDYLMPKKGRSLVAASTGIPYIGILEYAYGFSNRFSVGVMIGRTPTVNGYGLRLRTVLYRSDRSFRVVAKGPVFYYPKTKGLGGEPWALAWPTASAEWKLRSGVRIWVGGGAVVAACVNSMLGSPAEHDDEPHDHGSNDHSDEGFMGGIWNTLQAGVSVPVGQGLAFQSEVAAVMSGLSVADNGWIGGPPVILNLGFSYTL